MFNRNKRRKLRPMQAEAEFDEYSDEGERKRLRDQLYADLKWPGGPTHYPDQYPDQRPVGKDKDTEPSLELWRYGYLVLKAKERQRIFYLQFIAINLVIFGILWMIKRSGFL